MGLREDKKERTRRAIVDASLSLFRERGYDETRVSDVAAQLSISEGTFFNYFPSKQAVLEEAGGLLMEQAIAVLERPVPGGTVPVPEQIVESARAFARSFSSDREFAALLAAHTRFFSPAGAEHLDHVHRLLTLQFAEGQRRREIRDDIPAERLADGFLAVTAAMVLTWVEDLHHKDSLEHRLLDAAHMLLDGCATP